MIQDLLEKYRKQEPKKFGDTHQEKCYPVSAVIEMLEFAQKQGQPLPIDNVSNHRELLIAYEMKLWIKPTPTMIKATEL